MKDDFLAAVVGISIPYATFPVAAKNCLSITQSGIGYDADIGQSGISGMLSALAHKTASTTRRAAQAAF